MAVQRPLMARLRLAVAEYEVSRIPEPVWFLVDLMTTAQIDQAWDEDILTVEMTLAFHRRNKEQALMSA